MGIFALPPQSQFSRSRPWGRQGTHLKPGWKFMSRPGFMARDMGVKSRQICEITKGRHSENVEPSRPMHTHVHVKNMSDGWRMLFRIMLTRRAYCLATSCSFSGAYLSGYSPRKGRGPYCLPGCPRGSFLGGKPCVMGQTAWNPFVDTGTVSACEAWKIRAVEIYCP